MWQYLLNLLLAIDGFGCALLGGHPFETMSSYAYRLDRAGSFWGRYTRPAIDWLFAPLMDEHCRKAYASARAAMNTYLESNAP